ANKHMKRCATSLVTKEMQIKTTIRYHFTSPPRMVVIKIRIMRKKKKIIWRRYGETKTPATRLIKCKTVLPIWLGIVPQQVKHRITRDPASPLLDIYSTELETGTRADICKPMFTAALFTVAKSGK
ncbi:LORF2 protein, partial [Crocuta crocuta]